MNRLKPLLDLYLNSSFHVALAVTAFAGVTFLNLDLHADSDLLFFIFFGSVTGYNFVKYALIAKFQHFSLPKSLRIIQMFSLFCFVGLIWFALKMPVTIMITAAFFGLLTALYALPLFREDKNLRSITGVKIFVIAFVWAGVTVILPVMAAGSVSRPDILIEFVQRLLFVVVLTLPFDIRDVRFDMEQLGTVPQIFGVQNTRRIGLLLLIVAVFAGFMKETSNAGEVMVLVVVAMITAVLVRKSVVHQTRYYASFWVEGVPVIWWVFLSVIESF